MAGTAATTVTVAFASQGVDGDDDLYIAIFTHAGGVLSSNTTKLVDGYSNANIKFNETNASNPTTVSPNPYAIAVSATATQVYVKVYAVGSSSGEYYWIDDVKLLGSAAAFVPGRRCLSASATVSKK